MALAVPGSMTILSVTPCLPKLLMHRQALTVTIHLPNWKTMKPRQALMMATRLRKWTTAVRLMMAIHFPK